MATVFGFCAFGSAICVIYTMELVVTLRHQNVFKSVFECPKVGSENGGTPPTVALVESTLAVTRYAYVLVLCLPSMLVAFPTNIYYLVL